MKDQAGLQKSSALLVATAVRLHSLRPAVQNRQLVCSVIIKVKSLVRELGAVGALSYVVYRLCTKTGGLASLHRYLFVVQPVPDNALLPGKRGRSIVIEQVNPRAPILLSLPLDDKVLAYRAGQGAICFGAFKGGEIIGCLWLCLSPYQEDEVRCRYHPMPLGGSSWDFDVYLKPEHRNGLGFARLWDEANAFLRQRGIACSWSRISAFNPGSLAAHGRLGAKVVGKATFLRLGPCQVMVASMPPYVHLSLRRSAVPSLRLYTQKGQN
jgi:hypothetical protein